MGNRPGFHTPLENAYSIPDVQAIYAARSTGFRTVMRGSRRSVGSTSTTSTAIRRSAERALPHAAGARRRGAEQSRIHVISFGGPGATNSAQGDPRAPGRGRRSNGAIAAASRHRVLEGASLPAPDAAQCHERRRSVRDAMSYAHTVGVTTHIDQGRSRRPTPPRTARPRRQLTMHIPFLPSVRAGRGSIRLRINFLHMESDPNTPELVQRLKNAFPFSATTWCAARHRRIHRARHE